MIRLDISVAAEAEIDDSVVQQERSSLVLVQRVQRQGAVLRSIAGSRHARLDHNGPAELLRAGRNIERVQPLHVGA